MLHPPRARITVAKRYVFPETILYEGKINARKTKTVIRMEVGGKILKTNGETTYQALKKKQCHACAPPGGRAYTIFPPREGNEVRRCNDGGFRLVAFITLVSERRSLAPPSRSCHVG